MKPSILSMAATCKSRYGDASGIWGLGLFLQLLRLMLGRFWMHIWTCTEVEVQSTMHCCAATNHNPGRSRLS
jgi:hypothetical protein